MFNSICLPDGLERSSGTVNVPQRASTCLAVGVVSAQSSSERDDSETGVRLWGEHEARKVRSSRDVMKIRLISVYSQSLYSSPDCNREYAKNKKLDHLVAKVIQL